jgi:hypothetical protein
MNQPRGGDVRADKSPNAKEPASQAGRANGEARLLATILPAAGTLLRDGWLT